MKGDVFISYSYCNYDAVTEIKKQIEDATGIGCWMYSDIFENGLKRKDDDFDKRLDKLYEEEPSMTFELDWEWRYQVGSSCLLDDDTRKGIDQCKVFLLMLSAESKSSSRIQFELDYAEIKFKKIVFINVDDCDIPNQYPFGYYRVTTIAWNNQTQRQKLFLKLRQMLHNTCDPLQELEDRLTQIEKEIGKLEKFCDYCNGYGFKDKNGNVVIRWGWADVGVFNEGLAPATIFTNRIEKRYTDRYEKKGYIDKTNSYVIPCQWLQVSPFRDGIAIVMDFKGKWGVINKIGRVIIPCKWNELSDFSDGIARVKDSNDLYGFIDKTGSVVVPCQWKTIGKFKDGLAKVEDKNNKWGFINTLGNIVIPCQWDDACDFDDGIARVKGFNGKWGFVNKIGQLISPCQWNMHYLNSGFCDGFHIVQNSNGKWGFIDKSGRVVVHCQWNDIRHFSEGLAAVKDSRNKWGFIDKTGNLAIRCQWNDIRHFSEGLAAVQGPNCLWGFIDKSGEMIIPYKWEDTSRGLYFSDGLAAVCNSNLMYGFIDKTGRLVIPCKWDISNGDGYDEARNYIEPKIIETNNNKLTISEIETSEYGTNYRYSYKSKYYEENGFFEEDEDNEEGEDYSRDTWDAMTDGMYGDMPDGFDDDYDFLG